MKPSGVHHTRFYEKEINTPTRCLLETLFTSLWRSFREIVASRSNSQNLMEQKPLDKEWLLIV